MSGAEGERIWECRVSGGVIEGLAIIWTETFRIFDCLLCPRKLLCASKKIYRAEMLYLGHIEKRFPYWICTDVSVLLE